MFKFLNFSLKFIIIFVGILLFFVFSTLWYFSIGLPDYKKLSNYQPPISSRVYSGDNKLIAEYALEKRLFIPFESVPDKVVNAFLSAEDKNFFNHPGIDAKGILRAIVKNIKNISQNKRLEGASTITQQVAKNFLLSNEVSMKRKIKEAILAFRIERAYTKERILELYLNQIYLGQGTYGVAAASLEYFDKSIKQLNYTEAALLAALPKAPSKYNPYKYPDIAKFRRNLVIENLRENGFISKKQLIEFKKSELKLKKRKIEIVNEANSYTEEVRRTVKKIYGFEKLYSQGLSISTPLNIDYQIQALKSLRKGIEDYDRRRGWRGPITNKIKNPNWKRKIQELKIDPTLNWQIAEIISLNENKINFEIINKKNNSRGFLSLQNLKWTIPKKKSMQNIHKIGDIIFVNFKNGVWSIKQYPKVNGGIVILDPFTGNVLALVGGFNFKTSEFNRVTQAKRQPGSAFKPIVYAAALENGFAPNSIILDAPFVESQGVGLKNWKPENYGKKFYGPSTLRKGIEYSRNLMTVRIAKILGLQEILKLSKKLNIYNEIPELLSVSLGAAETTLLSLTSAYAPFVNGGNKIDPKLISRIQDRRGKTIYLEKSRNCLGCDKFININDENELPKIKNNNNKVISEETAYQMTSILQGAVERGTAKKLRSLKVPLAGKTGTTNDNFDAWFIGFSSNLVIGVYVGFDNPKTLGKFETGSKAALPIFKDFVEKALYKEDFREFPIPKNIYLTSLNYDTGAKSAAGEKNVITEALKSEDINNLNNNNLISTNGRDKIIKFRQFY